jgi:hypothetical protein
MAKYRKKPVVIEAIQWFPSMDIEGVRIEPARETPSRGGGIAFTIPAHPVCDTLEGPLQVSPGDWIITGVAGERYLCKDSIFRQTYEPVDAP